MRIHFITQKRDKEPIIRRSFNIHKIINKFFQNSQKKRQYKSLTPLIQREMFYMTCCAVATTFSNHTIERRRIDNRTCSQFSKQILTHTPAVSCRTLSARGQSHMPTIQYNSIFLLFQHCAVLIFLFYIQTCSTLTHITSVWLIVCLSRSNKRNINVHKFYAFC